MAAPRRAAAVAAAALRKASIGSVSDSAVATEEDEVRPDLKKEKKKVDWGDVEAKAKREAMWLLNWRKQQAAHAEAFPERQPPKKRRRKSCPAGVAPAKKADGKPEAADAADTATAPGAAANSDEHAQDCERRRQQRKAENAATAAATAAAPAAVGGSGGGDRGSDEAALAAMPTTPAPGSGLTDTEKETSPPETSGAALTRTLVVVATDTTKRSLSPGAGTASRGLDEAQGSAKRLRLLAMEPAVAKTPLSAKSAKCPISPASGATTPPTTPPSTTPPPAVTGAPGRVGTADAFSSPGLAEEGRCLPAAGAGTPAADNAFQAPGASDGGSGVAATAGPAVRDCLVVAPTFSPARPCVPGEGLVRPPSGREVADAFQASGASDGGVAAAAGPAVRDGLVAAPALGPENPCAPSGCPVRPPTSREVADAFQALGAPPPVGGCFRGGVVAGAPVLSETSSADVRAVRQSSNYAIQQLQLQQLQKRRQESKPQESMQQQETLQENKQQQMEEQQRRRQQQELQEQRRQEARKQKGHPQPGVKMEQRGTTASTFTAPSSSSSISTKEAFPSELANHKGMCLLAAAAFRRAMEEAEIQQQERSPPPRNSGEEPMALEGHYLSGSQASRNDRMKGKPDDNAAAAAAALLDLPAARVQSAGGVSNRGPPLAWNPGCPRLPWRPRELRFVVHAKEKPADVKNWGVPVAPSSSGSSADQQPQLQPRRDLSEPRSDERVTEAWWEQVPRLPGRCAEEAACAVDSKSSETGNRWCASPEPSPATARTMRDSTGTSSTIGSSSERARTVRNSSSASSTMGSSVGGIEGLEGKEVEDVAASRTGGGSGGGVGDAATDDGGCTRRVPSSGEYDSVQGRLSLRWLPDEALEALQAAGASGGMDRASLDSAAAEAEAADQARAEDERLAEEERLAEMDRLAYEAAANGTGPVMWGYDGYYDGGAATQKKKRPRAKRRKRETFVLVTESDDEAAGNSTSVWAGLEEAAKAEAKAILSSRKSGMAGSEDDNQHWVRRSVRAAGSSELESSTVVKLLHQIRSNDPEVEVLKLHHYLGPDVNTAVIDAVLEALMVNDNCQALYIQNFNEGFKDEQVAALAKVLARGNIWCLNAGENYKVELATWWEFVEKIKSTNVTHAYLSEHVITPDLKKAMRKAIRDNRVKHTRHKSASNLEVIRRCTNMWWNPINAKALQAELKLLDGAFPGAAPDVPPMATERVPCSLHPPEDEGLKRPREEGAGAGAVAGGGLKSLDLIGPNAKRVRVPITFARPESPDLTDGAPRGPCVFRQV